MKNTFQFTLVGFIFCFILKNTFSIVNNSFGGEPIYILSNPSIDGELWFIFGFTYLITVKVYFKDFFNLFICELNNLKKLKLMIDKYFILRTTTFFKFVIKVILLLFFMVTFGLGVDLFTNNHPESVDILNFLLFTYLTFTFNRNHKIINLKVID